MAYTEYLDALSSAWLRGTWSRAWSATIGTALEALATRTEDALAAWLPSTAPDDALPWLGDYRALERAPGEPAPTYRRRLRTAFSAWREAGSDAGIVHALAVLGFRSHVVRNNQWNWDGHPGNVAPFWARLWVVLDPPFGFGPAPICGGDAHAGDGAICGISGADAGLVRAILRTVRKWKASHAALVAVVVPLGGAVICGDGHHAGDGAVAGAWRTWWGERATLGCG